MRSKLETASWIAVGLACAMAAGVFASGASAPAPRRWVAPAHRPTSRGAFDLLDGKPLPPALADRRPIAVVIDNHPAARPQWGLSFASRVYEAITEGGVTRYLAVFGSQDAGRVGPVRSVRTQFLDYVLELDAAVAHAGGNVDALDVITALHIPTLDEFRYAGAYWRIRRRGVAYEHTMFTSTQALRALAARTTGNESQPADPPIWKDDAPRNHRPAAARISINFSRPIFLVSWVYRPTSNDYARMLAGRPHIDAATGTNLAAKVIAIAVVPRTHGRTRIGEDTWTFADLGSGPAWVLQDGAVTTGTWRKATRSDRLRFFDESGREVAFDRGPEWIEIIPPEDAPVFE